MSSLLAAEVTLNTFTPIIQAGALADIIVNVTVRYVDPAHDFATATSISDDISALTILTPEQIGAAVGVYQAIRDAMTARYLNGG